MRLPDLRRIGAVVAVFTLTACSALPSAAPTAGQIVRRAPPAGIAVIDIVDIPAAAAADRPPAAVADWPLADAAPWSGGVGVGDSVTVTVFEVGYALFSAGETSTRGDNSGTPAATGRTLPRMEVGEAGTVAIPYAGTVNVLGRSASDIAREIQRKLHGLSQNAQVVVTIERGPEQSVVISGDVKTPGRVPLTLAGERLLDVIAEAGGPTSRAPDTDVRLSRGDQSADIRLDQLRVGGAANVRLAPGDRVELARDVRTVTVLGSTKTVTELAFDSDRLSLAEAIARVGGPIDDRADATGVFVFRLTRAVVDGQPRQVPVIYRLNLLDPRSYFASQRFLMQPKDVLLVANARSAQFGKLVQLINTLVSPAITVDLLTR